MRSGRRDRPQAVPGGKLTGISFFTNQMEAKRLALLHEEIVPKPDLVGVLLNPSNPFFANQSGRRGERRRVRLISKSISRTRQQ